MSVGSALSALSEALRDALRGIPVVVCRISVRRALAALRSAGREAAERKRRLAAERLVRITAQAEARTADERLIADVAAELGTRVLRVMAPGEVVRVAGRRFIRDGQSLITRTAAEENLGVVAGSDDIWGSDPLRAQRDFLRRFPRIVAKLARAEGVKARRNEPTLEVLERLTGAAPPSSRVRRGRNRLPQL